MLFDEKLLMKISCFGFFMGAMFGVFMGVWAHYTLFWGRDSVNDVSMILCSIMTVLCAVAVSRMIEKKEAKKNEQI